MATDLAILMVAFHNHTLIDSSTFYEDTASDDEIDKLLCVKYALVALSTAGCLFNIIATVYFKLYQNVIGKMVINLSILDLLYTPSFLLMFALSQDDEMLSNTASVVYVMSWVGSSGWVCAIAHALYYLMANGDPSFQNWGYKRCFITISLITTILGIVTVIFNITSSCEDDTVLFFVVLIIIILSTSFIFCSSCYILVLKRIYHNTTKAHLVLLLYPLISMLCESPWLILNIGVYFNYPFSSGFGILAFLLVLSRGLLNALAYGLSQNVRKLFTNCCRSKRTINNESTCISFQDIKESLNHPFTANSSYITHSNYSRNCTMSIEYARSDSKS